MTLSTRSLVVASIIGTGLQLAMVVLGHYDKPATVYFPIGGMGFSLVAGLIYARMVRPTATMNAVIGGLLAGAICAFIGIFAAHLWGDVPASLLILGTLSSAVTGAIGGWAGRVAR